MVQLKAIDDSEFIISGLVHKTRPVLVYRPFTTDNQNKKKQNYLYKIQSYDATQEFQKLYIFCFSSKITS